MYILGINAYHGDSAAAIAIDDRLISSCKEERFTGEKHWAGIPLNSIKYCLKAADIKISEIDYMVLSKDPFSHITEKIWMVFTGKKSETINRFNANINILSVKDVLRKHFEGTKGIMAKTIFVEHHRAHVADAFCRSPFEDALIFSCDGAGDMRTAMWAIARNNRLRIKGSIKVPHSLGFLYTAFTQFLGFLEYGDEYRVMELASYGKPKYIDKISRIVRIAKNGIFKLDLSYFDFKRDSASMTWMNCKPVIQKLYSNKFVEYFGKERLPSEEINDRHRDIACSLQRTIEDVIINLLTKLKDKFKQKNLCLSGGVFANSVVCDKISNLNLFRNIHVSNTPGDAGTAVGALAYFYLKKTGKKINEGNIYRAP